MIKNFNDFKNNRILDNERESLERELRTRKIQKDSIKQDLVINFELIKRLITHAIDNNKEYYLSIGKRKEELEGTSETVFHIEFEDETLGRVRIFKPKDTSSKGHYEVNGTYYETSAKEVRDFYHSLNQEIKEKPVVFESIVSKMTPMTKKEIEEAYQKRLEEISEKAVQDFPDQYDDFLNTLEYFDKHYSKKIKEGIEEGDDNETIISKIIFGWE